MKLYQLALYALLTILPQTISAGKRTDAILLSKVKSLTLREGQLTTHRRVDALPQLSCIGGDAMGLYEVDVMRCENSGSEYDAEDIQWTCKANLPSEFKLGSTDVICEGYDSPSDPYVLKGSCAVEYRLMLTAADEARYPDFAARRAKDAKKGPSKASTNLGEKIATGIFWLIFGGIVIVILYSIFFGENDQVNRRPRGTNGSRPGWGGGGGGGGGGGDGGGGPRGNDDPPPPYTPRAPKSKQSSSTSSASEGWRPGFWSGTAAGAAAGYAAGSWNANRQQRQAYDYDSYARAGPSNPRPSPPSGGGGSSYASSSRHESTGFGGTSRR